MNFTMPIDRTVASKLGHTIEFKKGVPTHVPKECWREVQEAGAVAEDQESVAKAQAVAPVAPVVDDPNERRTAIFGAFETLSIANKREDFTAAGVPKTVSISAVVGFDVDAKERDTLWIEFTQAGGAQR